MSALDIDVDSQIEGRDFIRISLRSKSRLGRELANEARTPFTVPSVQRFLTNPENRFQSMEGYWAYVRSGQIHPTFGDLWGDAAKQATIRHPKIETPDFRKQICMGLDCKIAQSPFLMEQLKENTLDFVLYDVEDGETIVRTEFDWFIDHLNKRAKELSCRKARK